MRRKQNLASAPGFQKKKLGVTMHLSEILKLKFGEKKTPYIPLYFTAFSNCCCLIISKKCVVTPNFLFQFH